MSRQYLSLELIGYWRDADRTEIPNDGGVFCVYGGEYDEASDEYSLHRLIYIGESRNVNYAIAHHEARERWLAKLGEQEVLCYSIGVVYYTMRERCAAALIHEHRPLANAREAIETFTYDETEMVLSGKTRLLNNHFIVSPGGAKVG